MIIFLPKLFDNSRCSYLARVVIENYNSKKLLYEGNDTTYYGNSYGASLPEFNELIPELTTIVRDNSGINTLRPQHSFSRIYLNNSVMKKHKDRETLDLTLSVCIYNDTGIVWPLYVESMDGNIVSVVTDIGDGGLILGTKMNHWRDPLYCDENKMVIQTFFHWSIE